MGLKAVGQPYVCLEETYVFPRSLRFTSGVTLANLLVASITSGYRVTWGACPPPPFDTESLDPKIEHFLAYLIFP